MSSFLAYALRNRNVSQSIPDGCENSPPAVSAAISADSSGSLANEESFVTAPTMTAPRTPEGLRPRLSLDDLKVQLDLPSFVTPNMLPPLHPVASPLGSSSSMYTRSTNGATLVAESPDLSVGRARTAVGALVAQQNRSGFGVLPPRDWLDERGDGDDMVYQRLDDSLEVVTPSRARRSFLSEPSLSSTVDANSFHPSPSAWRQYQHYREEGYEQAQEQREDINLSFSSRLGLVQDRANRESQPYNFNSICAEQRDDNNDEDGRRDFVVSATDQMTNVSGMSQSTAGAPTEKWTWDMNGDQSSMEHDSCDEEQEAMDDALLQRKALNQRRRKETLVVDLVKRLQDNIDLVAGVEAMHAGDETLNKMFCKTRMDREGLLMGYDKDKRARLLNTIANLLHEMDVAQPEEFFMSPTNIPQMTETHNDLRRALDFLNSIVITADPESKIILNAQEELPPRWVAKTWLRISLGLRDYVESPESVYGGDTSRFSLPSESCDTPHTSNVSLATTITSRHSAAIIPSEAHQTSKLRRTVEIAATLLQKMTVACDQLLKIERSSSKESIMATEEIKRVFLQLMSLPFTDISSVVSGFTQELPSAAPLARIVSEDDHENTEVQRLSPPRSSQPFYSRHLAVSETEEAGSMACSILMPVENHSLDFFSPATTDMDSRMDEREYDLRVDDLRRDVGSFDGEEREGDDCEREGPDESFTSDDLSQYGYEQRGAFPSYESAEQCVVNPCVGEV